MQFSRHRLAVVPLIVSSIVLSTLVLGYAAAGFWGVPLLARSQLQKFADLTLHRQLSLGPVQFNPFTLELRVSELALKENNGAAIAGFKQLYVNAQLASLWEGRINLSDVQLDSPDFTIAIDAAGKLNLANLLPAGNEANKSSSATVPKIRIGLLSINEGHVGFSDLSKGVAFQSQVQQINIALKEFRTDTDYKNHYSISAHTAQKEQLEITGEFAVQPLASAGSFAIRALQLPPLASYLAAALPFKLADGKLSLDGQYQFSAAAAASIAPQWQLSLGKVTAENLAIAEINATGGKPPIMIPIIAINEVAVAPIDRKVSIKTALLQSPAIEINRDSDGVLNLSRLLGSSDAQAPVSNTQNAVEANTAANGNSQQSPQESPWQLTIIDSRVDAGTVAITDNAVSPVAHFALQPLSLQIANLGTDGQPMHLTGEVAIDNSAHFKLGGDIKMAPLQVALNLDLDSFVLSSLQPYLEQQTRLTLSSGIFALHASVSSDPSAFSFTGDINIENLHSQDKSSRTEFVDWKLLEVKGIKAVADADTAKLTSLDIDSIIAEEAYGNLQITADQTFNVAKIFSAPAPKSAQAKSLVAKQSNNKSLNTQTNTSAGPQLHISSIKIIASAADFADRSIEPNFSTGIVDLNGAISGLSSQPTSRATLTMQGKVDHFSPVDVNGEMNFLAAKKFADVGVKFSNMELTTFNPYSGRFAGYNISKGKLSAEMHYRINDRKLDAEHHVVLDSLEFGDKTDSKDAAPVPIKLAVALLKDGNDQITVDLPVSGTMDDPQFRIAPLVWKAFAGVLANVAKAPFAALGHLFGGHGDELSFVEFQPGIAKLSEVETGKLNALAKALVERPTLKLNIPLGAIIAADTQAMAQQTLHNLAPTSSEATARATYLAALELEYQNRSGQPMAYPVNESDAAAATADEVMDKKIQASEQALLPLLKPDADALADLGRRRANAVQTLLLGNTALTAERVFLVNEEADSAKQKTTNATAVKMTLHLE